MKNLKNKKHHRKYYVGLDIGTASVGWAVTDEFYNILKFNSKKMWGVRLFDGAETAEKRRIQRGARRRLNRKKERINLLQNFFAEEISKLDQNFFLRLENSDLYKDDKDKKLKSKYTLFNDKNFNDIDYHKKYPTIHHLIMDLIEDDSKKDVRLLYLACHYLIKNRGHFIFEWQKFDMKASLDNSIDNLKTYLSNEYDIDLEFNNQDLIKTITDNTLNKKSKKDQLEKIVGNTSFLKAISAVMIGSSQNLAYLFDDENLKNSDIKTVNFSTDNFDDKYNDYEALLGERIGLLNVLKGIYDASRLQSLLKETEKSGDGNRYISQAFIKKYEKHGSDLKKLKRLVKKYSKSHYGKIFRNENEKNNYVSYIKSNNTRNNRKKAIEYTSQDDFYKFIKSEIELIKEKIDDSNNKDSIIASNMLEDISIKKFMPKLKSSDNGVIPYQLKTIELEKILENQSKYYDFLNSSDEYGTVSEKIVSIMSFRIPYYVGPLNPESKHAWIKRKSQKITPWNFKEVVNLDASREEFIDRLIGRCTYLKDEKVLPKSSLLYNEYMVLNELNNLKLNALPITEEMKKLIFEQLFKTKKRVSLKAVSNLLKKEYNLTGEIVLSGTDGDFKQSLTSYVDFKNIIGEKIYRDDYRTKVEEIIKLIVLYDDDKTYLKKKIKAIYKNDFTKDEIEKISSLKYREWGRLSKKLLVGVEGTDKNTGEKGSIIYFMREYNLNLMELMSSRFTFSEEIKKLNPVDDKNLSYEMVDELYLSPTVKRMLWQSLKIVDEIKNIFGYDPEKIFIEMTREKGKKERKVSRKEKILDFYKDGKKAFIKEIGEEYYNQLLNEIKDQEESLFRWDNLFLYYTQLGRCMYSLEPIELSELKSKNIYDQDHIYPKSKIYDDSIENRVLVKKNLNHEKGNTYPIPEGVLNKKCYSYWKMLYDKKLIGEKKYTRLIRRTPFLDEELAQFIQRQIVETGQATKETARLLKLICEESEIVYSKAENVSRFRQEFDILKCRDVNDLHHMHDAFLNIVVGNVYNTKFTKNIRNFIKNNSNIETYNLEKIFKYDVKHRNYTAWIADDENGSVKNATIKKVKNEINGTNFRVTRMNYIKTGQLFDSTLKRKGKGSRALKEYGPRKSIEKYGGYTNVNKSYFMVIDIKKNNKKERRLVSVDREIYYKQKNNVELSDEILKNYLRKKFFTEDFEIIYPIIKMKSLLKINGAYYYITGGRENNMELSNALQLILPNKYEWVIKQINKSCKNLNIAKINGLTEELVNNTFDYLISKFKNTIYKNSYLNIYNDENIVNIDSKFKEMEFNDKCNTLLSFIEAIKACGSRQNLKAIDLRASYGRISDKSNMINDTKKYQEFKLVNQSITGLFENEVDLIKL